MEFNLDTTIKELHEQGIISVRTYNSLHYAGMDTLGEILDNIEPPMDLLNIRNVVESVTVYGKIPTKSLQIPTIANSSYSPDFMYVVRHKDGQTHLNLIVETKDIAMKSQLRGEEKAKIACVELFFKSLERDGYNVKYERQINSKGVGEIIKEILEQ